jgi:uncharacterized protein YbjT (DUF2867 family)
VRASAITDEMRVAAARAIAGIVGEGELREDYIIPSVFNRDVAPAVAEAVAEAARRSGRPPSARTRSASPPWTPRRTSGDPRPASRADKPDGGEGRTGHMRLTLTGATGPIGRRLVEALTRRGDDVTVLSRDARRAREALGVEAHDWDLMAGPRRPPRSPAATP